MNYVVGSGPAGVACATALVENGEDVTMLDVGLDLEPDRKAAVRKLEDAPPDEWRADGELRRIVRGMKEEMLSTMDDDDMPRKLRYGSDYPYRGTTAELRISRENVGGSASFARGGLSTVWGAQSLPFRDADIEDWPLDAGTLEPYYRKVFEMTRLVAERDDLARLFPLYADDPQSMDRSAQADLLMDRYRDEREALNRRGVYLGYSRLAMNADRGTGCPHCGLEIFGCCPRGSVYDATETLDELRSADNFAYRPGVVVEEVEEDDGDDTAVVRGRSYDDGSPVRYEGEKVFLACGTIPTTKILLRSLDLVDAPVTLAESPYFVLPMLTFRSAGDVASEPLNTLSQLYVEILDESISEYTVHFELFSYNELYDEVIRNKLGPLAPLARPFMKPFLGRFVVAMGYLHSTHNDGITARLTEDGELELTGRVPPETRSTVRAAAWKLLRNCLSLDVVPMVPAIVTKAPGESFHLGGSFPMSETPTGTETDLLGRPGSFERVHVVDSTVFPTVPATTITPAIMAMAYRIGDRHGEAVT